MVHAFVDNGMSLGAGCRKAGLKRLSRGKPAGKNNSQQITATGNASRAFLIGNINRFVAADKTIMDPAIRPVDTGGNNPL